MPTLGDGAGFPQLRGRVLARERPADGRCPVSAPDLSAEAAELREIITGLRAEAAELNTVMAIAFAARRREERHEHRAGGPPHCRGDGPRRLLAHSVWAGDGPRLLHPPVPGPRQNPRKENRHDKHRRRPAAD